MSTQEKDVLNELRQISKRLDTIERDVRDLKSFKTEVTRKLAGVTSQLSNIETDLSHPER